MLHGRDKILDHWIADGMTRQHGVGIFLLFNFNKRQACDGFSIFYSYQIVWSRWTSFVMTQHRQIFVGPIWSKSSKFWEGPPVNSPALTANFNNFSVFVFVQAVKFYYKEFYPTHRNLSGSNKEIGKRERERDNLDPPLPRIFLCSSLTFDHPPSLQ